MAEVSQDRHFIRGDCLAGGVVRQGTVKMWEMWEVREIKEKFIGIYTDEYVPPDLYKDDRLVYLLPTPTYINSN